MKDGERWSKLDRKRMSLPNCGGGPLTPDEEAEYGQLHARSQAWLKTQEAHDLDRIDELELLRALSADGLGDEKFSAYDESELKALRARHPHFRPPVVDPIDNHLKFLRRS